MDSHSDADGGLDGHSQLQLEMASVSIFCQQVKQHLPEHLRGILVALARMLISLLFLQSAKTILVGMAENPMYITKLDKGL